LFFCFLISAPLPLASDVGAMRFKTIGKMVQPKNRPAADLEQSDAGRRTEWCDPSPAIKGSAAPSVG
jgi:hypothetical protein